MHFTQFYYYIPVKMKAYNQLFFNYLVSCYKTSFLYNFHYLTILFLGAMNCDATILIISLITA